MFAIVMCLVLLMSQGSPRGVIIVYLIIAGFSIKSLIS